MRIFDKKLIGLLVTAAGALAVMFTLGPEESLDARFFYTTEEAHRILYDVTADESVRYFRNEIFDVALILLYSAFLFRIFQNLRVPRVWAFVLAFAPGFFDLVETISVLYALQHPGPHGFLSWLGYVTASKWLTAGISVLLLLCRIFLNQISQNSRLPWRGI